MADTTRLSLAAIADWHNVAWALQRTCRGKRRHTAVKAALRKPEQVIAQVSAALRCGHLPEGRFHAFTIFDPKQRVIHAAPLPDRIAHHAIVRFMEPVFERVLLPSVFACRVGKGVHAAIHYAQRQARRFPWVMHLDIAHYFPAIDHAVLREQLKRRFRGDGMALLEAVIESYGCEAGKGLPIGALTSQHFANHYLNDADRWALAQPEIAAHCRYMDDYLLWSQDREGLVAFRDRLTEYLVNELALSIKPPLIQRSERGIRFCGIHVKPFKLRPSERRRRRFRQALDHWERQWLVGAIDSRQLQQAADSARAILLPAEDRGWRRRVLRNRMTVDA
jgi:hypothetical protein